MRWFSLVLVAAMAFTASDAILLEAVQFKFGLLRQFFEKLHELKGRKLDKFKPAATTTYRPPTTTTDSCTQLVWETDANGNTISVLKNVCGISTTTTTYMPTPTTTRPTTTTDSCTQLIWETDAYGNTVSVLKNVCGTPTTTTTYRPTTATTRPTTTTDSCTQLIWETDAYGNTVSVLKNVCGITTTTNTPYRPPAPPATTTRRPATQTTTADPCTQEVTETDSHGNIVTVLKNVCGTTTTTKRPYRPPAPPATTTTRPTTTTTADPCTQEVTETDAHGNIVTVLRNVCGKTTTTKRPYRPPAPPATTTTRPTTTTTADPCTQLVQETDAYGNTVSVLKNVCGTTTTTKRPYRPPAPPATTTTRPTTTTTTDPCTEEVYEVFPNGEFVVVRKNICGETTATTTRRPTTHRPLPATTPTKPTSDPCTQEVWETLPNGEVTVVRKNVCVEQASAAEQTPRAPRTATDDPTPPPVAAAVPAGTASVDECTQEAWEVLPNGEAGIVRRNVCVEVVEEERDECIQEVEEEAEECLDECITRKELKCETNNKEVCVEREGECEQKCALVLRNQCDSDNANCRTQLVPDCSNQAVCEPTTECLVVPEEACGLVSLQDCGCQTVTRKVKVNVCQ